MVERIAGALPASGAPGPSAARGFEKALQGANRQAGSTSFPKPANKVAAQGASRAEPPPRAIRSSAVEPGSRVPVSPTAAAPARPRAVQVVGEIERAQARLDQLLKMAESGRTFSPAELLAFQAHAYRASQELDLAGKVVEKGTSAVKQTLQTQI